jgi:ABC-type nickel/cobalt efflux system permease component RcnA
MEFIAIGVIIATAIWVVWRIRAKRRAEREATLHQAWHVVLDDPDYARRRRYEERRHDDEVRARKEANGA